VALHLADSLGPLVLRSWLERDGEGEVIAFAELGHARAVLRRIAHEAGALHGLRQLVFAAGLSPHALAPTELVDVLATLLVRGQLELVRLPYALVISERVEHDEVAPFVPEVVENSGIRERIVVQGRLDAPAPKLDGELGGEPPPELEPDHELPPPPELETGIDPPPQVELEPQIELEQVELALVVDMGLRPREGGDRGAGEDGPLMPLDGPEPTLESGLGAPTLELETGLELEPEREP